MVKSTRFHLLLIVVLDMVVFAMADYHLGYSIISYSSTNNTLANGVCCGETCDTSCRTTLRLCFRDAGHSSSDVESSCNPVQNRENTNIFAVSASLGNSTQKYYSQTFQIYVRVSHSVNEDTSAADFDPPFTDPLIDDIFIEANVSAVSFSSLLLNTEVYTVTGNFGTATLTMAVNARCVENYFGDGCEMLCDADGNNCDTVLTPPPPPKTMTTETPETDLSQTSSTDQPNSLTTGPLVPITDKTIIPIAVGVSIAVLVLIIIGVVAIILIIYFVNRSKNRAWNPKRSAQPHFTMERAERSITNNINEEVEYATVNELHFVVSNEEEEDRLAGYETIKRLPPTKEAKGTTEDLSSALTYASLDIQPSGAVIREIDSEENDTEDEAMQDQKPVHYAVIKQDSD